MTRFLAPSLMAALLVGLLCSFPAARAEKNPEWGSINKEWKDLFKTKQSIKQRRQAVTTVYKSKDPRGVKLLLGGLKKQEKHAGKMRDEWEEQEEEWAEKTARIEEAFEKKRKRIIEQAKKRGEEPTISIDLNSEEGRWLGIPPDRPGEMHKEKERLQKLYGRILDEEEFGIFILRGIAKILNGLEGDEYTKAAKPVLQAALKAPVRHKEPYVRTLGYVKGDAVTDTLAKIANDSKDIHILMLALESLGRQNTDKGVAVLLGYLDNEQWQIRAAAIQGLAFYKKPEVMDALIKQAVKEEGAVRRRCFSSMSIIVGERVKGTIEAWQSWWEANKEEWIERWSRLPASGPIEDDPPVIPVDSEEGGGTSFYGLRTDSKHIIFVVDVSGSMRRTEEQPEEEPAKIDVARKELINAVKSLSAQDEDERGAASYNVVLFSTTVSVYKENKMVVATKKNKDDTFKWIEESVLADGMTNCFDALEQAFNIIRGSEKKSMDKGADTIFFMTDGFPNRGKFWDPKMIVQEITRMNKERKLTIHCIGVGNGHHAGFLQELAASNNGKYLAR